MTDTLHYHVGMKMLPKIADVDTRLQKLNFQLHKYTRTQSQTTKLSLQK